METSMSKQEKAMMAIGKCKNLVSIVAVITRVLAAVCLVLGILVAANQQWVNEKVQFATDSAQASVVAVVEFDIMGGIVHGDADLQSLVDKGEYALVFLVALVIFTVALAVISVLFRQMALAFSEIEKSQTPFAKGALQSIKRVFILVSVLSIMTADLLLIVVLAVLLVCIYRVMGYGAALQDEVDEIL